MTIVTVDVHETRHTCPGNTEPHWFDRHSTIVSVVDGGPCRTPVTIRTGDTSRQIPCGRHVPDHRCCIACRTLLIVRHHTHTDLGWHGPSHLRPCASVEVTA